MASKARPSGNRHSEAPFFHLGQRVDRSGATRVDLRRWAYVGLAVTLLGLVGWLYLEQASEVAAYGYEIRQLENDRERLRREITALRAEVAMQGSLQRLRGIGEALGYAMPGASDPERYAVVEYRLPPEPSEGDARVPADGDTGSGGGAGGLMRAIVRELGALLGIPEGTAE